MSKPVLLIHVKQRREKKYYEEDIVLNVINAILRLKFLLILVIPMHKKELH
jgi:hypothetical protein